MKKQVIAIALMSAVISLTGCSININDDTMSQAAKIASSMLDDADIKVNGQDVNISLDSNGDVNVSLTQSAATAAVSADIQGIAGTWYEADVLNFRTLTVKADGSYELAYKGGGAQYGTVKAETEEHPDGSVSIWYNFYETDGTFWTGFSKSGETQCDLYSGQDGAMHFTLGSDPVWNTDAVDITPLVGEWYFQIQNPQNGAVYDDAGFVTIEANCTYVFQPNDGSLPIRGTIKLDYDEYPNGDTAPIFSMYNDDGNFWIGAYCNQNDPDIYYTGNGGTERLIRKKDNANPFDEYVGQWQSDRCSIRIFEQGTGYGVEIHWADSASEDNVWTYSCDGSNDGTYLECVSGGTLVHVVTDADGKVTETEMYHDGTAKFNIKGGTLFWQDGKEDIAQQMGFAKIG